MFIKDGKLQRRWDGSRSLLSAAAIKTLHSYKINMYQWDALIGWLTASETCCWS